jgi:hypothetical protein
MVFLKKTYVLIMPVLFAVYSVLAFFSNNIQVEKFSDITWILAAAVIFGGILTVLFIFIFRDRSKASLIATCWMIIIFSYGQVYNVVHQSLGVYIGRNVILLPIAFMLMALSVILIWKFVRDTSWPITFFGWMIAILCFMTFYTLARYYISINGNKQNVQAAITTPVNSGSGPNIYYIILDAHGRQDILHELYGYNDSEFIQFLKDKGFFVGDASHSNYVQTDLSISSSLNMQYLDTIGLPVESANAGRNWLEGKIKDSQVREILVQQGYKLVSFNNTARTALEDADVYYNFDTTPIASDVKKLMGSTEIQQMFLASTLGRVIIDLGLFPKITSDLQQYKFHYLQTKYTFDKLSEIPSLPGKYFIFAHILAPHPPFVFNPDGSYRNNPFPYYANRDGSYYPGTVQDYINGYRDQVAYVDTVMEKVITDILSHSNPAPIIIIQGDHGPGAYLDWNSVEKTNLDERLGILNAYYFPGRHSDSLYASISPVNSFRVLFNTYFGTAYPLLEDKSYYSTWTNPFTYIDVTDKLRK